MGHAIDPTGTLLPASPSEAMSEDYPGVSSSIGPWTFVLSGYRIRVRTKIQCVVGRDAGKDYFSVDWGGDYEFDKTPVPSPIAIRTSGWGP